MMRLCIRLIIYNLAEELDDKPQVDTVSTITDYLPPESIQKKRLKELRKTGINAFIDNPPVYHNIDKGELFKQFERLNDNIIEMGQLSYMAGIDEIVTVTDQITGTPDQAGILPAIINRLKEEGYKHEYLSDSAALFYRLFSEKSKIMKVSTLLTIVDLPEDIRNRFLNKKGDSFLTSVYAKGNLWDNIKKPYGKNFIYMLRDKVPQITGSPIFLTIITTMASFGTLMIAKYRGIFRMGVTLFIVIN